MASLTNVDMLPLFKPVYTDLRRHNNNNTNNNNTNNNKVISVAPKSFETKLRCESIQKG